MTSQALQRSRRDPFAVQRAVLFALILRELKTRFGGRWLGVYWALLEPLAHIVVLVLLLGAAHRMVLPGVDYPVFLLTGMVPFFLFKNLVLRLMEGIDSNRSLFGYRQVKPVDTLLARAVLEIALYGTVSVLMFAAFAAFDMPWWPAHPLENFALGVLIVAGGFGLGLCLAVATNDMPKARSFVRVVFMPLYLLSGVMASVRAAPSEWWPVLLLNPLLHVVELSRGWFLPNYHLIEGVDPAYVAVCALVALASGLALYRVRRHHLLMG